MPRCVEIGSDNEPGPGQRKLAFVDGQSIVVFNIDGALHAIENSCPHNGAALASGRTEGNVLSCPAHGLRFDLGTGCMVGNAALRLKKFPIHPSGGKLILMVDDQASDTSEPALRCQIQAAP